MAISPAQPTDLTNDQLATYPIQLVIYAVYGNRAVRIEAQIRVQTAEVNLENKALEILGKLLAHIKTRRAAAEDDDDYIVIQFGETVVDPETESSMTLLAYANRYVTGMGTSEVWSTKEFNRAGYDALSQDVQSDIDSKNSLSQQMLTRLQSLINKSNEFNQTISEFLTANHTLVSTVVGNIGR